MIDDMASRILLLCNEAAHQADDKRFVEIAVELNQLIANLRARNQAGEHDSGSVAVTEMRQQAACTHCDNPACRVLVVIPALSEDAKHFSRADGRLDIVCPSCQMLFSVPILRIAHYEVTDDQLKQGFIRAT